MNEVYIAFGSNKGDRRENIRLSMEWLSENLTDCVISEIFETDAEEMVEGHNQPFLNGVVKGKTDLSAFQLIEFLQNIEKALGRKDKNNLLHYSREIDLDLLLFNQDLMQEENLILPHPRMHQRIFVLKPLLYLNPELIIPGINLSVKKLYDDLLAEKS